MAIVRDTYELDPYSNSLFLFCGRRCCILRSPADFDAFQSGRCAEHNGRPESLVIMD